MKENFIYYKQVKQNGDFSHMRKPFNLIEGRSEK